MPKEIPLSRGRNAIVDDDMWDELSQWRWYCTGTGYARRTIRTEVGFCYVLMHRLIIAAPEGSFVDHIDGDTLNNTRANLRLCNIAQNGYNRKKSPLAHTSRFKGVSLSKNKRAWRATIGDRGIVHIGTFATEESAARAYDQEAIRRFGPFARINFPKDSHDE